MSKAQVRQPPAGEDAALAIILPIVDRLRHTVDAENGELARSRSVDYHSHSQRKSQGLLELNRMRAALASASANPIARAALGDLSAKLDLNRRLLQVQLRAARTVSGILARAIREGQSDGTYSAHAWRENEG
jgi:hypothetical protein